jgi:two-component system chemotaxis response regulator CheY
METSQQGGTAMRVLIVEDDFASRRILQTFLGAYGECHVAVNGIEAIEAFKQAWEESQPYDLICMDIMMPEMNGQEALRQIRDLEKQMRVKSENETKVIMTTALDRSKEVVKAFYEGGVSAYFVKPFKLEDLEKELKVLRLIS